VGNAVNWNSTKEAGMTTTIIAIAVIAVIIALIVGVMANARRKERELDLRRDAAAAHRDEAGGRERSAREAELAAREQSVRAERQRIEAEAQADRAQQEREAAELHAAEARRIDPDLDDPQDAIDADPSTASRRVN
jgi:FtsZ-interacting cell division protein ZipA